MKDQIFADLNNQDAATQARFMEFLDKILQRDAPSSLDLRYPLARDIAEKAATDEQLAEALNQAKLAKNPTYKNGTPAKAGEAVIAKYGDRIIAGTLTPLGDPKQGEFGIKMPDGFADYVGLRETYSAADAFAALEAKQAAAPAGA